MHYSNALQGMHYSKALIVVTHSKKLQSNRSFLKPFFSRPFFPAKSVMMARGQIQCERRANGEGSADLGGFYNPLINHKERGEQQLKGEQNWR